MGSLSRRGYKDWLVQRVSAVLIGGYALFLVLFLLRTPDISYTEWATLFAQAWMRVLTILVVVAVCWHAWIGLWTVFTDYVKCGVLRMFLQVGLFLLLMAYLVWCIGAFWA